MTAAIVRGVGFVGAIVVLGILGCVPSSDAVIVAFAILMHGDATTGRP